MSQFKRFNSSDNGNWNSGQTLPEGTLTWDPNNGLRIHDGNTSGGNQVGGGLPINQGGGALNDLLFGGASSDNNGKVLIQNWNLAAEWGYPNRIDNADAAIGLQANQSVSFESQSGLMIVTDQYNGWTYGFLCGGGSVVKLGGTNTTATGGASPDTCTVTGAGGAYVLTNISDSTRNFGVAWVVTRHSY